MRAARLSFFIDPFSIDFTLFLTLAAEVQWQSSMAEKKYDPMLRFSIIVCMKATGTV
jgi:hypothetical protein